MKVAVVGVGVVGMSTAVAMLDAGVDVTVYGPGPVMGERSAGATRIFRFAHVDPDLVRLARLARRGFVGWSTQAGRPTLIAGGCVITGADLPARAAAMAAAGAGYELVGPGSNLVRIPATASPAASLVDVDGGVVDVDAVRDHLSARAGAHIRRERVYELGVTAGGGATVTTASGTAEYDAVVLAAGANTSHLGAQVGIHTSPAVAHHVRFTFRVEGAGWQSWIDTPAVGFGTYQHQAGPGLWAVGGHVDPARTAWEVGREAASEASREAILEYVKANLVVDPTIVDSLYCTSVPHGDGVGFGRNGPFLAIDGGNLMKFAPVLGSALAAAAADGSTPSVASIVAGA